MFLAHRIGEHVFVGGGDDIRKRFEALGFHHFSGDAFQGRIRDVQSDRLPF